MELLFTYQNMNETYCVFACIILSFSLKVKAETRRRIKRPQSHITFPPPVADQQKWGKGTGDVLAAPS